MSEELPENHKAQITAGRRDSMIRAGIPAGLHENTLADLSGNLGEQIFTWLQGDGHKSLKKGGTSWLFDTRSKDAERVMLLTARALHLNGLGSRVVRLGALTRMIENRDYDAFDELMGPQVLFVTGFFDVMPKPAERPFTAYQRRQIEDLLIDRIGAAKANVLQLCNPHKLTPKAIEWWTPASLDALQSRTLELAA